MTNKYNTDHDVAHMPIHSRSEKGDCGEKILVVYFSHSGNTRTVTEQITRFDRSRLVRQYNPKKPIPPTTIQSWIKLKKR